MNQVNLFEKDKWSFVETVFYFGQIIQWGLVVILELFCCCLRKISKGFVVSSVDYFGCLF